jgi:hypothetical protein
MPIREQQTTNKQHAIPQSIMSVEFKIIGDLTLKQFFFLLIFCGLAYTSFIAVQPFVFKWLLVIFFVVTGMCFAFLPLGDRGLDVWIVNFLRAMFLPNQFVYRKQEEIPNVFLYQNLDVLKSELITLTPTSSRRKIEAYLEQQEVPADKLDFDEKSYILKVKEAYSTGYAGFSSSSVTTTVVEDVSPIQVVTPQVETVVPIETPQTGTPRVQGLTELELPAPKSEQLTSTSPTPQVVQIQTTQPPQPHQDEIIKSQSRIQPTVKQHQKPVQPQDNYYSPSMTPDMHAGRRFINLADGAGRGDIVLPIRGERVLNSLGNSQFDQNEAAKETQKVQQLDELINQIKNKQVVQKQIIESQKIKDEEEAKKRQLEGETQKTKQEEIIRINEENKRIQEQEKLAAEKGRADRERLIAEQKAREQAANEQERLQKLREQEEALRRQKEELIKKQRQEELDRQLHVEPKPEPQAIPLKSAQINETPTTPNTIWGVVVTIYQGSKVPVPAVVVIIRNQRKEVVRAVKTSGQGKFGITNPLINGSYTIEVDKEKRSGLTFDITAFEAKGAPIPTIEIVGKV